MSAYMVHEQHINVMVWAAVELASPAWTGPVFRYADSQGGLHTISRLDTESLTRTGQMLVDANADSMASRYGEFNHGYQYQHRHPHRQDWTAIDVLKAISCYEDQSCETGTFSTSEAGSFCQALSRGLIARLPGMDSAPWEITPNTLPAHAAA
ncbi:hypothetical protein ACT3TB_16450 [Micrococcaceae sp. AOP34-BR2-30]